MRRKRRSDRNHIIYKIENVISGDFYIGITVLNNQAYQKSIKKRFKEHISCAFTQKKDYPIYNNMREYGIDSFHIMIYEVVRGKLEAHKRETELIKTLKPQLNTISNEGNG